MPSCIQKNLTPYLKVFLEALDYEVPMTSEEVALLIDAERVEAAAAIYQLRHLGYVTSWYPEGEARKELLHLREDRTDNPQKQEGLLTRTHHLKHSAPKHHGKTASLTFHPSTVALINSLVTRIEGDLCTLKEILKENGYHARYRRLNQRSEGLGQSQEESREEEKGK